MIKVKDPALYLHIDLFGRPMSSVFYQVRFSMFSLVRFSPRVKICPTVNIEPPAPLAPAKIAPVLIPSRAAAIIDKARPPSRIAPRAVYFFVKFSKTPENLRFFPIYPNRAESKSKRKAPENLYFYPIYPIYPQQLAKNIKKINI